MKIVLFNVNGVISPVKRAKILFKLNKARADVFVCGGLNRKLRSIVWRMNSDIRNNSQIKQN